MKHSDAEKLLGGFAAGILTEEEKGLLFSAALENQELFDALADEEALREFLADPDIRRHLLALMEEANPRNVVPFWRRPLPLGLAASLFALVTTSLALWQRERPAPSKPAPVAETQREATAGATLGGGSSLSHPAPGTSPTRSQSKAGVPQQAPAPSTEQPAAVSEQLERKAEALADHAPAFQKLAAAKPQPVVGAVSGADTREAAAQASLSAGIASGVAAESGESLSPPSHVLERLEGGAFRLTITWVTGNHLYVVKRTPVGAFWLRPISTSPNQAGRTVSTFEFRADAKDQVDLYVLAQPAADPKALPAEGAIEGYRKRVL